MTSNNRPPPFIVCLRTNDIANNVIRAKHKFNLLHTRDLDLSLLDQSDVSSVISSNIYFNEVLTKSKYINFQNLKNTAKKLGFKYAWHRKGSFLVKCCDGVRSPVFQTTADLDSLASTYMQHKAMHNSVLFKSSA